MYTIVAVDTTSFCVYTQKNAPTVTNIPHVPTYQITLPTYIAVELSTRNTIATEDGQLSIAKFIDKGLL